MRNPFASSNSRKAWAERIGGGFELQRLRFLVAEPAGCVCEAHKAFISSTIWRTWSGPANCVTQITQPRTIAPIYGGQAETSKTVTAALVDEPGVYAVGTPSAAQIGIDEDGTETVCVSATVPSIDETVNVSGRITVTRKKGADYEHSSGIRRRVEQRAWAKRTFSWPSISWSSSPSSLRWALAKDA